VLPIETNTRIIPNLADTKTSILWGKLMLLMRFYGGVMAGYVVARLILGNRWWLVSLINNFIPWCASIALIFAIMSLLSRRWQLVVIQLPLILLAVSIYSHSYRQHESITPPSDALPLTIATYNIHSVGAQWGQTLLVSWM
jgi:hypothetical protein